MEIQHDLVLAIDENDVPFPVYYASGTSIAKFPEEGVLVLQSLKNQGKSYTLALNHSLLKECIFRKTTAFTSDYHIHVH